jgi:hypothetical protein
MTGIIAQYQWIFGLSRSFVLDFPVFGGLLGKGGQRRVRFRLTPPPLSLFINKLEVYFDSVSQVITGEPLCIALILLIYGGLPRAAGRFAAQNGRRERNRTAVSLEGKRPRVFRLEIRPFLLVTYGLRDGATWAIVAHSCSLTSSTCRLQLGSTSGKSPAPTDKSDDGRRSSLQANQEARGPGS